MNTKPKNKTSNIVLLSIISFVLIISAVFGGLKLSGAWFTDNETLHGDLEIPYLKPINLQNETINNSLITIRNASDLNKTVKLKFGSAINVDYFVLRFTVAISVGTMSGENFVPALDFADIDSVKANINTTDFEIGSCVNTEFQSNYKGYYYYKNLIQKGAADISISLINGFTDAQNLLSQGYVFQVVIQSNVAVPGQNSFNTFSLNSGEGSATDSWKARIQTQVSPS